MQKKSNRHVFLDSSGKQLIWSRYPGLFVGGFAVVLMLAGVWVILAIPRAGLTGSAPQPLQINNPTAVSFSLSAAAPTPLPIVTQTLLPAVTVSTATLDPSPTFTPEVFRKSDVIGFYVNWDENSLASLKQNINTLNKLIPEWLFLKNASGAIQPENPAMQKQTLDFIKSARPGLPVMVLVNNYSNTLHDWDRPMLAAMLANPAARMRNIQALLDYVKAAHLQGINIDYESVPPESKANLVAYMRELYARFQPLGLEVSQSVPVDDPGFDYPNLAKYSDYLILMVYDEHWSTSEAGPVASQKMFADALSLHFSTMDPSRFVIGIGGYGYDWVDGTQQATDLTYTDAMALAQKYNVKVLTDPASLNPTYDYSDAAGKLHHVWFLDAATASQEIKEGQRYPVRGFALWRMGSEDPSIWQVFAQVKNP